MDAELTHPRAQVADGADTSRLRTGSRDDNTTGGRELCALQALIHDVHAHRGLAIDVPLRAATDLPDGEVHVASRDAGRHTGAHKCVSGRVVLGLDVAAVDRGLPRLVPVVLVSGVDAPRGR